MPELKRRGYQVEMLIVFPVKTNDNQVFTNALEKHGILVHEIYGYSSISPFFYTKVFKLLKLNKYDIVQANLIHADLWMSLIKAFSRLKFKLISCKHGYDVNYQAKYGFDLRYLKRYPYYWIEKFACLFIDHNITISKALSTVFVNGGIAKAERVSNIYYGLTLTSPASPESEYIIPQEPYVLITGRLIEVKGHRYLIDAWKIVHQELPELKLYIAGDGDLKTELKSIVSDTSLGDNVIFLGHMVNPHPIIKNALFTVVTSSWEGFGLVLLESWMHKKPIIAFDAPAMNEVIDNGENGLLVPFKDTHILAEKIIWLYKNSDKISELGNSGFNKLVSYYTLKRMTDETEQIYKTITHNSVT
jgi:glycosyltransferase involved in cell wall biosynthesis